MLGAIIGDIVGSVYEFNNIKTTDFLLFSDDSQFTDDTVMTLAVAEALMEGGKFGRWLASDNTTPYNSYGNGSAMRFSPVACAGRSGNTNAYLLKIQLSHKTHLLFALILYIRKCIFDNNY